jgi:hypothetical protein
MAELIARLTATEQALALAEHGTTGEPLVVILTRRVNAQDATHARLAAGHYTDG